MAYNILEGFLDREGALDKRRLDAARAIVAEIDPDVLVLNEALHCRPGIDGKHHDYAAWFNYPHVADSTYDGGRWGNAVLSKHPILSTREFSIHNRSGIVISIRKGRGKALSVATYHPHPSRRPANKAADFAGLINGVSGPCVVCGDFNSINPEDSPNLDVLSLGFTAFTPPGHERASAARFIDGGEAVFEALAALGYRDAVPPHRRAPTMPTPFAAQPGAGPNDPSAMRIDHFVANELVRTIDGGVLRTPLSETASDHFPVWLDVLTIPETTRSHP
jgi:endonuclease/exonuclease/phosphatase family metal-dependent hydrolase